jgi:hypothetical protein
MEGLLQPIATRRAAVAAQVFLTDVEVIAERNFGQKYG